MTPPELLSALADGQLSDEALDAALEACAQDDAALECWNTYHLIGEVLRSPASLSTSSAAGRETGFATRLSARLSQESIAPAAPVQAIGLPYRAGIVHHRGAASNDGSFRWKLAAGVASLAAVSAVAWNMAGWAVPASAPQLAQAASPQVVVASPQGPMVRDARLEELLEAHRQLGTASALQESSAFLRNATFEAPRNAQAGSGF